jgi:hypothetical protein
MLHGAPIGRNAVQLKGVVRILRFRDHPGYAISDTATVHVPNLVCVQQFCMRCESEPDIDKDCAQCGKLKHPFWEDDPVGDLLTCLCRP